jgi:hypothetical protein
MSAPADLEALARHLITLTSPAKASGLPRFRWKGGMLNDYGCRTIETDAGLRVADYVGGAPRS